MSEQQVVTGEQIKNLQYSFWKYIRNLIYDRNRAGDIAAIAITSVLDELTSAKDCKVVQEGSYLKVAYEVKHDETEVGVIRPYLVEALNKFGYRPEVSDGARLEIKLPIDSIKDFHLSDVAAELQANQSVIKREILKKVAVAEASSRLEVLENTPEQVEIISAVMKEIGLNINDFLKGHLEGRSDLDKARILAGVAKSLGIQPASITAAMRGGDEIQL